MFEIFIKNLKSVFTKDASTGPKIRTYTIEMTLDIITMLLRPLPPSF